MSSGQRCAVADVPAIFAGEKPAPPWLADLLAGAGPRRGYDPATIPDGWLDPLTNAGVPVATGGRAWTATVDPAADALRLDAEGLHLPPLPRFIPLTSLPLKPLRLLLARDFSIRLQIATGVRCWLWDDRLLLANGCPVHRGGFLHGPRPGMRMAVALEPGEALGMRW